MRGEVGVTEPESGVVGLVADVITFDPGVTTTVNVPTASCMVVADATVPVGASAAVIVILAVFLFLNRTRKWVSDELVFEDHPHLAQRASSRQGGSN